MITTTNTLPTLRLVALQGWSILDQLTLEEALLRTGTDNWCLFNCGSSPAIVLGISGKIDELVNQAHWEQKPIPLIRRFSGGGTVVVGADTLFVTLIINQRALPTVACYPEPILRWTDTLYSPLLPENLFQINENDYTIGDRKFGGNAQYICRERWLHHTSLLWDFDDEVMGYLLPPRRQPRYREQRSHQDFLCRLKDYMADPQHVFAGIQKQLSKNFQVDVCDPEIAMAHLEKPHRRSTHMVTSKMQLTGY